MKDKLGKTIKDSNGQRRRVFLGATSQLRVDFEVAQRDERKSLDEMTRKFFLQVGKHQAVLDCEIQPVREGADGDTVELLFFDPVIPRQISPDWELVDRSPVGDRTLLRFQRLGNSQNPLRLLSIMKNHPDDVRGAEADSIESADGNVWRLQIPRFLSTTAATRSPVQIALGTSPGVQASFVDAEAGGGAVRVAAGDSANDNGSVPSQAFLESWVGYRGPIAEVRTFIGVPPGVDVSAEPETMLFREARTHLHLAPASNGPVFGGRQATLPRDDGLESRLHFQVIADVSNRRFPAEWAFRLPAGFIPSRVMMEGVDLHCRSLSDDGAVVLLISQSDIQDTLQMSEMDFGDGIAQLLDAGNGLEDGLGNASIGVRPLRFDVHAIRTIAVSGEKRTTPFRLRAVFEQTNALCESLGVAETTFHLTRDPRIVLTLPTDGAGLQSVDRVAAEWAARNATFVRSGFGGNRLIADQMVQVAAFDALSVSNVPPWMGSMMNAQVSSGRQDARTQTRLERVSGRWQFEFVMNFGPKRSIPAFVDVAIPSRWTADLEVVGAQSWLQQASPSGDVQWLRLAISGTRVREREVREV
ncbi:MAG: hypothetical protein AAF989_16910, partial [Planctomycetota bacterium]